MFYGRLAFGYATLARVLSLAHVGQMVDFDREVRFVAPRSGSTKTEA